MGAKTKNFGAVYRYECKKILRKKIVWISFSLGILISIFSVFAPLLGNYYIEGKFIDTNYNMYRTDRNYARALSGRKIDQELLEETIAAYRKVPQTTQTHYTSTEEYQKYARPYSEIFNFIRHLSGMQTAEIMYTWQPNEEELYAERQIFLTSLWEDLKLSKGETDFWTKLEAQIKTPYVYEAHGGYDTMLSSYQTIGLLVLMLIAICLSGIFSDEHLRKTDQLILSCPLGKTQLYWAKIAAGISFAVISTILFFVSVFVPSICLYGAEGFQAAFQFIYNPGSDPISCGQAVLIAYGNMAAAAVITSVLVMVLSELLRSNIATLAISVGLLIAPLLLNIPEQYRILAQIWNWLPWSFLALWNVFGRYTLSIFGHYLTPWQAVPLIYLAAGMAIAAVGKPIYQRFQVSGR